METKRRAERRERRGLGVCLPIPGPAPKALAFWKLLAPSIAAVSIATGGGVSVYTTHRSKEARRHAIVASVRTFFDAASLRNGSRFQDPEPKDDAMRFVSANELKDAPYGLTPVGAELSAGVLAGNAEHAAASIASAAAGAFDGSALVSPAQAQVEEESEEDVGPREAARLAEWGLRLHGRPRSSVSLGAGGGGAGGTLAGSSLGGDAFRDLLKAAGSSGALGTRAGAARLRAMTGNQRAVAEARRRMGARLKSDSTGGRLGEMHGHMSAEGTGEHQRVAQLHTDLWSSGQAASAGAGVPALSGMARVVGAGPDRLRDDGGALGDPLLDKPVDAEALEQPDVPPVGPSEDRTPNQDLLKAAQILSMVASVCLLAAWIFNLLAAGSPYYAVLRGFAIGFAIAAIVAAFSLLVIGIVIAAKGDALQGIIFAVMGALMTLRGILQLAQAPAKPEATPPSPEGGGAAGPGGTGAAEGASGVQGGAGSAAEAGGAAQGVTETVATQGVTETVATQGVTETVATQGVTETVATQGVVETTVTQGVTAGPAPAP